MGVVSSMCGEWCGCICMGVSHMVLSNASAFSSTGFKQNYNNCNAVSADAPSQLLLHYALI